MVADEPDSADLCLHHLAERIGATVLSKFTESRPEVQMSWDAWNVLALIIEDEIKAAFGDAEDEGAAEPDKPAFVQ
jgi:hypothetical protein